MKDCVRNNWANNCLIMYIEFERDVFDMIKNETTMLMLS